MLWVTQAGWPGLGMDIFQEINSEENITNSLLFKDYLVYITSALADSIAGIPAKIVNVVKH